MNHSGFISSMFSEKLYGVQGMPPPIIIKVLAPVVVSLIVIVVHTQRLIFHKDMRRLPRTQFLLVLPLTMVVLHVQRYLLDVHHAFLIYGMHSDAECVNTLNNEIRKRGAMNTLTNDRAQAKISKHVKDILRSRH